MWEIRFHFHVRVSSWGTNPSWIFKLIYLSSIRMSAHDTWSVLVRYWFLCSDYFMVCESITHLPYAKHLAQKPTASSSSLQLQSSWPSSSDSHLQFFHPDHGSSDDICNVVILGQVSTPCHLIWSKGCEKSQTVIVSSGGAACFLYSQDDIVYCDQQESPDKDLTMKALIEHQRYFFLFI